MSFSEFLAALVLVLIVANTWRLSSRVSDLEEEIEALADRLGDE